MANHAYVSFWTRERAAETMLDRFGQWLEAFPLSAARQGFNSLTIRAVSPAEGPLVEHDLRGATAASDVIALAREHENADCSYEVQAHWDVWQRSLETGAWQKGPEQVFLICNGRLYDDGVADQSGDFLADIGFEHMFTGHAGLLGGYAARSAPSDPVEAEFLAWMTHEEHLHEYYEKTRANIQLLLNWVDSVEKALALERHFLWSEGEENLEARLDEILAVH
ncbi:MAG: hypothetical protein DMG32_16495 [Acidobacteria bacterium]|nr:MAG: hypothetical protein DMG32_16495 [Acidobacteriota bacterium]